MHNVPPLAGSVGRMAAGKPDCSGDAKQQVTEQHMSAAALQVQR